MRTLNTKTLILTSKPSTSFKEPLKEPEKRSQHPEINFKNLHDPENEP